MVKSCTQGHTAGKWSTRFRVWLPGCRGRACNRPPPCLLHVVAFRLQSQKDSRGSKHRSGQGELPRKQGFDQWAGAHCKPPHLSCEHRRTIFRFGFSGLLHGKYPKNREHCRNKVIRQECAWCLRADNEEACFTIVMLSQRGGAGEGR